MRQVMWSELNQWKKRGRVLPRSLLQPSVSDVDLMKREEGNKEDVLLAEWWELEESQITRLAYWKDPGILDQLNFMQRKIENYSTNREIKVGFSRLGTGNRRGEVAVRLIWLEKCRGRGRQVEVKSSRCLSREVQPGLLSLQPTLLQGQPAWRASFQIWSNIAILVLWLFWAVLVVWPCEGKLKVVSLSPTKKWMSSALLKNRNEEYRMQACPGTCGWKREGKTRPVAFIIVMPSTPRSCACKFQLL